MDSCVRVSSTLLLLPFVEFLFLNRALDLTTKFILFSQKGSSCSRLTSMLDLETEKDFFHDDMRACSFAFFLKVKVLPGKDFLGGGWSDEDAILGHAGVQRSEVC